VTKAHTPKLSSTTASSSTQMAKVKSPPFSSSKKRERTMMTKASTFSTSRRNRTPRRLRQLDALPAQSPASFQIVRKDLPTNGLKPFSGSRNPISQDITARALFEKTPTDKIYLPEDAQAPHEPNANINARNESFVPKSSREPNLERFPSLLMDSNNDAIDKMIGSTMLPPAAMESTSGTLTSPSSDESVVVIGSTKHDTENAECSDNYEPDNLLGRTYNPIWMDMPDDIPAVDSLPSPPPAMDSTSGTVAAIGSTSLPPPAMESTSGTLTFPSSGASVVEIRSTTFFDSSSNQDTENAEISDSYYRHSRLGSTYEPLGEDMTDD
jgi:hypothetical protein